MSDCSSRAGEEWSVDGDGDATEQDGDDRGSWMRGLHSVVEEEFGRGHGFGIDCTDPTMPVVHIF